MSQVRIFAWHRFLRFADRRNTRKQHPFEKSRFGPFREENVGVQKRGLENWILDHTLRPRETHSGVSEVLSGLKCPGSYPDALEALGRLLAKGIWKFGKKMSQKIARPPSE